MIEQSLNSWLVLLWGGWSGNRRSYEYTSYNHRYHLFCLLYTSDAADE